MNLPFTKMSGTVVQLVKKCAGSSSTRVFQDMEVHQSHRVEDLFNRVQLNTTEEPTSIKRSKRAELVGSFFTALR